MVHEAVTVAALVSPPEVRSNRRFIVWAPLKVTEPVAVQDVADGARIVQLMTATPARIRDTVRVAVLPVGAAPSVTVKPVTVVAAGVELPLVVGAVRQVTAVTALQ